LGRAVPDVPDKHGRVLEIVRAEYAKSGFEWLVPLGFENTFVLVIRGDEARRQSVTSLSEAAGSRVRWRLGIGQEFKDRKDGLPSLVKTYDLPIAPVPTVLNLTRLYRELEANTVDMISANSTDGLLSVLDVRPLEDDRHFFPPYDAGLVVSTKTLNSRPRLRETLRQLEGKFSPQQMQQMNYLIDGEHREPAVVADTFLRDAGLGGAPR
jgi:glycine betaine/choline ABC-type transport system substrate-binding protein